LQQGILVVVVGRACVCHVMRPPESDAPWEEPRPGVGYILSFVPHSCPWRIAKSGRAIPRGSRPGAWRLWSRWRGGRGEFRAKSPSTGGCSRGVRWRSSGWNKFSGTTHGPHSTDAATPTPKSPISKEHTLRRQWLQCAGSNITASGQQPNARLAYQPASSTAQAPLPTPNDIDLAIGGVRGLLIRCKSHAKAYQRRPQGNFPRSLTTCWPSLAFGIFAHYSSYDMLVVPGQVGRCSVQFTMPYRGN